MFLSFLTAYSYPALPDRILALSSTATNFGKDLLNPIVKNASKSAKARKIAQLPTASAKTIALRLNGMNCSRNNYALHLWAPARLCAQQNLFFNPYTLGCVSECPGDVTHNSGVVKKLPKDCPFCETPEGTINCNSDEKRQPISGPPYYVCQKQCNTGWWAPRSNSIDCEICEKAATLSLDPTKSSYSSSGCNYTAIMIDAGGSGTRLYLMEYPRLLNTFLDILEGIPIEPPRILQEYKIEGWRFDITDSDWNLRFLPELQKLVAEAPESDIYLFWTAGKRADLTLAGRFKFEETVSRHLRHEGFNPDRLYTWVIDGTDEARFLYYAVNTYLGLLGTNLAADIFELGSQSAQIMMALREDFEITYTDAVNGLERLFTMHEDATLFYAYSENFFGLKSIEKDISLQGHCARSYGYHTCLNQVQQLMWSKTSCLNSVGASQCRPINPRIRVMFASSWYMTDLLQRVAKVMPGVLSDQGWHTAEPDDFLHIARVLCPLSKEQIRDLFGEWSTPEIERLGCFRATYFGVLLGQGFRLSNGTTPHELFPVKLRFDLPYEVQWVNGALLWSKWMSIRHDKLLMNHLVALHEQRQAASSSQNTQQKEEQQKEAVHPHIHDEL